MQPFYTFDPTDLGGLLGKFGNDEQDRKDALRTSLMALGMGLLGARKGQQWNQAGAAGMNALNAYQGSLNASERRRKNKMEEYVFASDLANKISAQQAAQQDQQALSGIFSNPLDLANMGQGGPTEANAAATRVSPADQYRKAAAYYAQRGNIEAATKYSNIADKMDEEYSMTPQVVRGPDGKLQLVQFGKRGGTKTAPGMTPAEKLHFGTTGGQTNVGFDPYSGEAVSAGLPATMTPDQVVGNEQWQKDYQLRVNADRRAAANAGAAREVKPQLVGNQWVYPPDAQSPTGRAVTPEGINPPKEARPPEAYTHQSAGIANLNTAIKEYKDALAGFGTLDYLSPDARAAIGTKYNNMMLQAKEAFRLGVLNGPDYSILQSVVADPTSVRGAVTSKAAMAKQASELGRIMQQNQANLDRVYGQTPAQRNNDPLGLR